MKSYETIIILNPEINEEKKNEVLTKIKNVIEKEGKIEKVDDIGKRKMAYEIKKHNEGYYYLLEFKGKSENIAELERTYRITDEILKFLIVRKDD